MPPRCDAWSIFVSSDGRQRDLERAEQAEAEHDEHQRDEPVHPGIRSELHDTERTQERLSPESIAVNMTTMPRQNRIACTQALRGLFRKNDSVIGIIGNTQGVKIAASPKPNATSRKLAETLVGRSLCCGLGLRAAGLLLAGELGVAGGHDDSAWRLRRIDVDLAVSVVFRGRHSLSVHA